MTTTQIPPTNTKPQLILASSSAYRQQQLRQLRMNFSAVAPNVDETPLLGETARELAIRLAQAKASTVATQTKHPALVIGSDQTASCQGRTLGKPGNTHRAIEQLTFCQNKTVTFYTALTLLNNESQVMLADTITTEVRFRPLSQQQIQDYIKKEEPLDCAGSFKCEGLGIALFESISSDDPSALIGLPLIRLTSFLNQLGASPL